MRSVSLMLCPVPKPLGAPLHLISGSVTMTDRVVLKQHPRWQEPLDRFSDHGRSGGSQTLWGLHVGKKNVQQPWQIRRFSNALDKELVTISGSATMADWAVLKLPYCEGQPVAGSVTMTDRTVLKPVGVDMPFELGIPISKNCKICQVFLFLRPARSFFRSGSRISASVYSRPDGGMDTL